MNASGRAAKSTTSCLLRRIEFSHGQLPESPDSIRGLRQLYQPGQVDLVPDFGGHRDALERLWREHPLVILGDGAAGGMTRAVVATLQKWSPPVEAIVRRHVVLLPHDPTIEIDDETREHFAALYAAEVLFYPSRSEEQAQTQIVAILEALECALDGDGSLPSGSPD